MKRAFLAFGLVCINLAAAEVRLQITEKGIPAGIVRWSIRISGSGRTDKQVILPPGKGPAKTIEWTLNAKGDPTKISFSMPSTSIIEGRVSHGVTTIVTAFPKGKDSETVIRVPGSTIHRPTPAPPGLTNDPTAFWFVRDHPKEGEEVSYYAFDIQNLKWDAVDRTFVGKQTITGYVGDLNVVKEMRAGIETTFFLDDHAEPVLIVSGDTRMVRQ